jgi:hypothetical protein
MTCRQQQPRPNVKKLTSQTTKARLTVWNDSGHQGVTRHWGEILEAVTGP